MDTNEIVFKTLETASKPLRAGEIATAAGIEKPVVEKAIKALVKLGKIDSPVRCCYAVKK